MSVTQTRFTYNIEDVNQSIRRTNTLLRAANALRLTYRDIKQVMEKPTITNVMWTLVQISRTYNALRRVHKLVMLETSKAAGIMGFLIPETPVKAPPSPEFFSIPPLSMRVDAFLDHASIPLGRIDLSNLREDSRIMIQAIMEEEAEITVRDAQQILTSRIIDQNASTGDLATSIGWESDADGVRIFSDLFYSWWVEEGHRLPGGGFFTGHHYLRDATMRTQLRLPEKIRTQLNGLISDGL